MMNTNLFKNKLLIIFKRMKISELNLIDLNPKFKYTNESVIPDEINISIKELEEFNNRIIIPSNISPKMYLHISIFNV